MRVVSLLFTGISGISARRAVLEYLRIVALVLFVLLSVAWTIDLAANFPSIRSLSAMQDIPLMQNLLPYLTYRSADIILRMLPTACFFGIFVAELLRRARLESVILAAAGNTALRALGPILVFGLIAGTAQQQLESRGRPAAVEAQVALGLGDYAGRFRPTWFTGHSWFLSRDTAIRARVFRNDPPAMRDLLIFNGLRDPRLQTIYAAEYAEPASQSYVWKLTGVEKWNAAAGQEASEPVEDLSLRLPIIPEQLTYFGVPSFYLPYAPLVSLASQTHDVRLAADASLALWRRRSAWFIPGVLAMLGFAFAKFGYSGRRLNIARTVALAVVGYILVVSLKVYWTLGELLILSPVAAVASPLAFMLALSTYLIFRRG